MAADTGSRRKFLLLGLAALVAVVLVYLPILGGGFVWDDKLAFRNAAWLRHGSDWWYYAVHGISGGVNYFRPLVVALFALELRLFDVTPAPMHAVSLLLHVLDTALVGVLAVRVGRAGRGGALVAMLLYGLHPALLEPVAWISCQYDLVATLFVLLALIANTAIARPWLRAALVGATFLLGATAKESAACLPPLLLLCDLAAGFGRAAPWRATLRETWRRQWPVYAALLAAGVLYLALRAAALGHLLQPVGRETFFSLAHGQKVAATYLAYWRVALWPMTGLGPLHVVDETRFAAIDALGLARDLGAIGILAAGAAAFARRRAIGALVLCFSAALWPVLHLVPTLFMESLYHERYAMLAIALGCAWLPRSVADATVALRAGLRRALPLALAGLWLALALLNIRVTLPLWGDELALWQWALRQDPASIVAKAHLLSEYMAREDRPHVDALIDDLLEHDVPCSNCLLNIAYATLAEHDETRAAFALERLQQRPDLAGDPLLLHGYLLATGQLLELRGQTADAEGAYRAAIESDPLDPMPHLCLALLLAQQGRTEQARAAADRALALFPPDERPRRALQLDAAIRASGAGIDPERRP